MRPLSLTLPALPLVLLLALAAVRGEGPPAAAAKEEAVLYTPASALAPSLADVRKVPAGSRAYQRFVSAYHAREADLPAYAQTLAFVTNSLSRNPIMVPPVLVAAGHGRLWRVDLEQLHIDPAAWDELIQKGSGRVAIPAPHFNLIADTVETYYKREYWQGGVDPRDGKWYAADWYQQPYTRKTRTFALAPWLPAREAAELATECQTQTPLVRADWLFYNALLEPAYSRLLDIQGGLADAERLAGVRRGEADAIGEETKGIVLRSEVAEHIRGLRRIPTIRRRGKGYFWISDDYETSINADDLLANADAVLDAQPAAHEVIFSLPNGLNGYQVDDAAGKRLDRAAINVARDTRNGLTSVEVEVRNCLLCHSESVIPIQEEVRLTAQGELAAAVDALRKKSPRQAERFVEKFLATNNADEVIADQHSYAAAVKACNGLGAAANGLQLRKFLLAWEKDLSLEDIARETGYPVETVKAVLQRTPNIDHSVLAVLRGRKVRRDQFDSRGMAQLMVALSTVPEKKK